MKLRLMPNQETQEWVIIINQKKSYKKQTSRNLK